MTKEKAIKEISDCIDKKFLLNNKINKATEFLKNLSEFKIGDVLELKYKYSPFNIEKCWVSNITLDTAISGKTTGKIGYGMSKIKKDGTKSNQRFPDYWDYDIIKVIKV